MRVAVIGAGIVGVTTAYELVRDGHQVTVFERRGSVAAESSFANAGVMAPGHIAPWPAQGPLLRSLLNADATLRVHPTLRPATLGWLMHAWRASRARTFHTNRLRLQRLAFFSRERLHAITQELKLDYERSTGCLVLLRSKADLSQAKATFAMVRAIDARFEIVEADRCRALEPGLNPDTELAGGVHLPDDEIGNCREFATLMRTEAQRLGARFRFHTHVQRILPGRPAQLVHVYAPPGESAFGAAADDGVPGEAKDTQPQSQLPSTQDFDAIVVCAAIDSSVLLRPHGLKLPLLPVYGYSVTAPLRHHEAHPDVGPRSGLLDERYQVAISRLGTRVRVAGGAEIGGVPERHHPKALATLYKVLNDWFPGAAQMSQVSTWKGARPMLPDGPPLLGHTALGGVWLNLGHGGNGWALACGSARLLADAVAGRPTPIALDGLGIERLRP